VTTVPVSALVRRGSEWAVYRVREGRAWLTPITIGHLGSAAAEVLQGLAAGEKVIIHPSDRIAEGVRVRP
jgi:HlyD family secretion protein